MTLYAWLLLPLALVYCTNFGIMLDADSTATTVHVFAWEAWDSMRTQVVQVGTLRSPRAIHTVVNASDVISIVSPLLAFAATQVPEEFMSQATVYVKATAGMRALQTDDPAKADSITQLLRATLAQTRFNYDAKRNVIMPGNQQSAFAWLALRHLSETNSSVAIDMGSLALGVAYMPDEAPLEGYFPLRVGDQVFGLYTHDFFGYGADAAWTRYERTLTSVDPCLWSGAREGGITGLGNFTACRRAVESVLFSAKVFCSVPPCSLDGVAAPKLPLDTTVTLSGFFPTLAVFGCQNATNILSCLANIALRDCDSLTFQDVVSQHPTTTSVQLFCFNAALLLETFEALGISQIHRALETEVGWPLGAMLYEIGLASVYYDTTEPPSGTSYGIVVDAGSTGSRCYVYSWNSRDVVDPNNFPIAQQVATEYRVNPGLATLTADKVKAYLQPCIDYTRPLVPAAKVSQTPIILMATAGMRVLFIADQQRAEGIMDATRALFAQTGYLFEDSYVSILPGELEGAFAWLTVLLLLKNTHSTETCAIADMGGSSSQLAFLPPNLPLASYVPMSLGARSYDLYSHSYLFYGQNGATDRHWAYLLARNASNDPCGWRGYVHQDIATGALLPTTRTDFEECVNSVREQLLGLEAPCAVGPCGLNGVYSPRIPANMKIYAFSGFTYLSEFFYTGYEASMQNLYDAALRLCESKDWATIKQERSSTPSEFVAPYCFAAAYFYTLMVDGYGVSPLKTLYQYRYLSDNVIGFTLGGLMYYVGLLRLELQPTAPPTPLRSRAPSTVFPTTLTPSASPSAASPSASTTPTKSPHLLAPTSSFPPTPLLPVNSTAPSAANLERSTEATNGDMALWIGLSTGLGLIAILGVVGVVAFIRMRRRKSVLNRYAIIN